jgi:hypothetical protein
MDIPLNYHWKFRLLALDNIPEDRRTSNEYGIWALERIIVEQYKPRPLVMREREFTQIAQLLDKEARDRLVYLWDVLLNDKKAWLMDGDVVMDGRHGASRKNFSKSEVDALAGKLKAEFEGYSEKFAESLGENLQEFAVKLHGHMNTRVLREKLKRSKMITVANTLELFLYGNVVGDDSDKDKQAQHRQGQQAANNVEVPQNPTISFFVNMKQSVGTFFFYHKCLRLCLTYICFFESFQIYKNGYPHNGRNTPGAVYNLLHGIFTAVDEGESAQEACTQFLADPSRLSLTSASGSQNPLSASSSSATPTDQHQCVAIQSTPTTTISPIRPHTEAPPSTVIPTNPNPPPPPGTNAASAGLMPNGWPTCCFQTIPNNWAELISTSETLGVIVARFENPKGFHALWTARVHHQKTFQHIPKWWETSKGTISKLKVCMAHLDGLNDFNSVN